MHQALQSDVIAEAPLRARRTAAAMTDLVTGATGFIGSHLAERLLAHPGRRVRVMCRKGSEARLTPKLAAAAEIVNGDLRDPESLMRATTGVRRVFHCAGHVLDWGVPGAFDDANVRGTSNLLEASRRNGVERVVHFSSIAVFGTPSPPVFDDGSAFGDSRDSYTRTKIAGEEVAAGFVARGLDVVILRPAVVYGPRGTWLEQPLAMIEAGKMVLLGGGAGTCHPCYIENLVDATLLAAEHPEARGRAYIVGDGDSISFRAYFDALASIAGRPPVTRSLPLPLARAAAVGMEWGARVSRSSARPLLTRTALDMVTTRSVMSMDRIRQELGFTPRYEFAGAVAELRAWYQAERRASP